MSRAELRRAKREKEKAETATFNLTKAQLDAMIEAEIGKKLKEIKIQATEDAINTTMTLLLVLPPKVLAEHYWQKSYQKKMPEFTQHMLDYYSDWVNGKLDLNEMQDWMWDVCGIRFEESEM